MRDSDVTRIRRTRYNGMMRLDHVISFRLAKRMSATRAFQLGNIQISLDEGFNEIHENRAHDPSSRLGGIIAGLTRAHSRLCLRVCMLVLPHAAAREF